ncbi:MAG: haloacid dehalogenase type II [Microbacteriaceae bacterium]|nr:haloacid dehalogenase type II [Microbacteriaceae bacterium]
MIREVFFDVNETLTDFSELFVVAKQIELSDEEVRTWFSSLLRDGFALAINQHPANFRELGKQLFTSMIMEKGVKVDDETIGHFLNAFASLPAHPDLAPTVRDLVASGFSVNTLSNGSAEIARRLMKSEGIDDLVSRYLSVSEIVWKPHPLAYKFALDSVEVEASACVLVAVHPWDIHGAIEAGMRAVWINRGRSHYPSYFHQPTKTVDTLQKLPSALVTIS